MEKVLIRPVEEAIAQALRELRFGSVEIIVHDSRVVQIERREKLRVELEPARRASLVVGEVCPPGLGIMKNFHLIRPLKVSKSMHSPFTLRTDRTTGSSHVMKERRHENFRSIGVHRDEPDHAHPFRHCPGG